jgi:hypothetical protein
VAEAGAAALEFRPRIDVAAIRMPRSNVQPLPVQGVAAPAADPAATGAGDNGELRIGRMSDKPPGDPLAGPTYRGFATRGVAPGSTPEERAAQPPPRPRPRRAPRRTRLGFAGLLMAAAAATGALAAMLWPENLLSPASPPWLKDAAPAPASAPRPASPAPAPAAVQSAAAIPAGAAAAPAAAVPSEAAAVPAIAAAASPAPAAVPRAEVVLPARPTTEISAPVRRLAAPLSPPPRREARGRPTDRACEGREAGMAQLLCRDPQLASLDRQVNAAFAAAMRGSAAPGELADDQESWILRRDRAARETPDVVPDLYRERIAVLQARAGEPAAAGSEP